MASRCKRFDRVDHGEDVLDRGAGLGIVAGTTDITSTLA